MMLGVFGLASALPKTYLVETKDGSRYRGELERRLVDGDDQDSLKEKLGKYNGDDYWLGDLFGKGINFGKTWKKSGKIEKNINLGFDDLLKLLGIDLPKIGKN